MHVGIAYLRWRGKRSRHSRRMRTRNFAYLARGPCHKRAYISVLATICITQKTAVAGKIYASNCGLPKIMIFFFRKRYQICYISLLISMYIWIATDIIRIYHSPAPIFLTPFHIFALCVSVVLYVILPNVFFSEFLVGISCSYVVSLRWAWV